MRGPRTRIATLAAVVLAAVTLAACGGSSNSSSTSSSSSSAAKVKGGTATYAFNAGGGANYIFPILPPENFSTANSQTFGWLMWRPL